MYNGIGLHTPRGSGTNGYVQTNKFFVKPRSTAATSISDTSSTTGNGDGGIRNPNKDILDHERKRQIELRLLVLRETLADQGYTDVEIAAKLDEVRRSIEEEESASAIASSSSSSKR